MHISDKNKKHIMFEQLTVTNNWNKSLQLLLPEMAPLFLSDFHKVPATDVTLQWRPPIHW